MPEPTKVHLARALQEAGFPDLAARATNGEFDDYEAVHALPKLVLVTALYQRGQPGKVFGERVKAGEFDNTKEEAQAWYEREGKDLLHETAATAPEILALRELAGDLDRLAAVCRRWAWHEVAADMELTAHSIRRRLPKEA